MLLLLLTLVGCRSALHAPVELDSLIEAAGSPTRDADAATLLKRAEQRYATAQADGVREAVSDWLQAYRADPDRIEALAAATRGWIWLADRAATEDQRRRLSRRAVETGQYCLAAGDDAATCRYALALALGAQARERRSTGLDALPRILELLTRLVDEAPQLDHAGPDRTLALVYLRAPGWPTGPGDPDLGLEHAQAASDRAPDHVPNRLALAEGLAAVDDTAASRRAYEQALALAEQQFASGNPHAANWVTQARSALAELQ